MADTSLPCGKRQALLLNLPHMRLQWRMSRLADKLQWRPNTASVRPSGLFPSDRNRPVGSLMTGIPADAKPRAIRSFRAWHKAVNPTGVYHRATMTLMRNAQIQPEPQANSNSHCLVIHLQSARGNWQGEHPPYCVAVIVVVFKTLEKKQEKLKKLRKNGKANVPSGRPAQLVVQQNRIETK